MQILRDRRTWAVVAAVALVAVAAVLALVRETSSFVAATSSLGVISGDVEVLQANGSQHEGKNGEDLIAGTTVRPQPPDGRAVLRFRDGSTQELEPGADVTIEELSLGTRGELVVRLRQDRGRTWSYVQPQLSPNSRFHVITPSGTAVARGTSFEIDVSTADGVAATRITVLEGRVDLAAEGKVESVGPGHTLDVARGSAPQAVQRMAPPDTCLRFEASSNAMITVTDPYGRAAGQTRHGAVSQVPLAIVSGPAGDVQAVEILTPISGEWEISISPRGDGGEFRVMILAIVGTEIVDQRALVSSLATGEQMATRVRVDDGRVGRLGPPSHATLTRAVALPFEPTTTAIGPVARVVTPEEDRVTLGCIPPEGRGESVDVEPVGSPERTAGR